MDESLRCRRAVRWLLGYRGREGRGQICERCLKKATGSGVQIESKPKETSLWANVDIQKQQNADSLSCH